MVYIVKLIVHLWIIMQIKKIQIGLLFCIGVEMCLTLKYWHLSKLLKNMALRIVFGTEREGVRERERGGERK